MTVLLPDGFYWFRSERSTQPAISQVAGGEIYCFNEAGPVSIDELARRGWVLWKRVTSPGDPLDPAT